MALKFLFLLKKNTVKQISQSKRFFGDSDEYKKINFKQLFRKVSSTCFLILVIYIELRIPTAMVKQFVKRVKRLFVVKKKVQFSFSLTLFMLIKLFLVSFFAQLDFFLKYFLKHSFCILSTQLVFSCFRKIIFPDFSTFFAFTLYPY